MLAQQGVVPGLQIDAVEVQPDQAEGELVRRLLRSTKLRESRKSRTVPSAESRAAVEWCAGSRRRTATWVATSAMLSSHACVLPVPTATKAAATSRTRTA